ncbi:MAG TPA: phytanoyl-CoA dioxygenase family protein [Burkholderiales bacterium]|nr:phytanoyl-CoA dioxygenase family protein [Burkholderiales bacterium]
MCSPTPQEFSAAELAAFHHDGYAIVRGLAERARYDAMKEVAERHLAQAVPPVEYEADVHYPGSPPSYDAPGGRTIRRLLQAYARDPVFARWATDPAIAVRLRQLLGAHVMLSQAHHNCVMTKQPRYSSATGWHRDIRYWAFERPELISVWVALGREVVDNGCLLVLPGTHAMEFAAEQLDTAQFLRTDVESNRPLLQTQIAVELEPGDALFFHCRLFHAAGRNRTVVTKFSPVFTYHAADNRPLAGTRSTSPPSVVLG